MEQNAKLGMRRGIIQMSLYRGRRADLAGWILFTALVGSLVGSVVVGVRSLS